MLRWHSSRDEFLTGHMRDDNGNSPAADLLALQYENTGGSNPTAVDTIIGTLADQMHQAPAAPGDKQTPQPGEHVDGEPFSSPPRGIRVDEVALAEGGAALGESTGGSSGGSGGGSGGGIQPLFVEAGGGETTTAPGPIDGAPGGRYYSPADGPGRYASCPDGSDSGCYELG